MLLRQREGKVGGDGRFALVLAVARDQEELTALFLVLPLQEHAQQVDRLGIIEAARRVRDQQGVLAAAETVLQGAVRALVIDHGKLLAVDLMLGAARGLHGVGLNCEKHEKNGHCGCAERRREPQKLRLRGLIGRRARQHRAVDAVQRGAGEDHGGVFRVTVDDSQRGFIGKLRRFGGDTHLNDVRAGRDGHGDRRGEAAQSHALGGGLLHDVALQNLAELPGKGVRGGDRARAANGAARGHGEGRRAGILRREDEGFD